MSFKSDGYRTGFPKVCPVGRPGRIVRAEACGGCVLCVMDCRGYWRCDHEVYQSEPGVHFCEGCGIELGGYAEAHGWCYCGGPTGRCRYDGVMMSDDRCTVDAVRYLVPVTGFRYHVVLVGSAGTVCGFRLDQYKAGYRVVDCPPPGGRLCAYCARHGLVECEAPEWRDPRAVRVCCGGEDGGTR